MRSTRLAAAAALLGALFALGGCETMSSMGDSVAGLFEDDVAAVDAPAVLAEDFQSSINVEEVWSKRIGKGSDEFYLKLTPTVIDGKLFVADFEGKLAATDLATGKVTWDIQDKNVQYTGGPGGGDGLVLIGTGDGRVIARESASGKLLWVAKVSSEVLAAPRAGSGTTVVRTGDGKVYGLDSATGATRWLYDLSVPSLTLRGTSAPVIDDDLAIVGFDNGRLAALDLRSGKAVWDSPLALPSGRSDLERMVDVDADPVVLGATVFVASFHGQVAALSIVDGQIQWTREISSYNELAVGGGRVYVTDEDGAIWALDRNDGNSLWKQDALQHRYATAPVYFNNYVVVGDFEGYIHWLDAATGDIVYREQIDDSRIIAPPIDAGEVLLGYSSSGRLVAMQPR
ncbi:MAG: outer membrane protein assembly factor BamB [Gammaproteobacteria bacterium]|nr:outer membrane protein assembly factor BamB [Gammaproteobacteria bacterium]